MSNAAALYLPSIPTPRPDLVVVKMGVEQEQKTSSATIYIPQALQDQEQWRQTLGTVVTLGAHIATDSRWGTALNVGDTVIVATMAGDVYLIKDEAGEDEQYRFVSPLYILGKIGG